MRVVPRWPWRARVRGPGGRDRWDRLDAGDLTHTSSMAPVFTGGTGRSGTTIAAKLIGAHPSRRWIMNETKFLSEADGLCDLVEDRVSIKRFEERLLTRWFQRKASHGLFRLMDRSTLESALPGLRAGLARDPYAAARAFAHRLFDPIAEASGAAGWIETTPANVLVAPTLLRIFPDMRLVHCVRDGRDAACSVVPLGWGPGDLGEALDWWATRLERGFAACDGLPDDRVLVVQLEDLVVRDRERQYARLLAFLGIDDHPAMRAFFEQKVSAEGAHLGRWLRDVPPDRLPEFEAHYRRLVEPMIERGRPYAQQEPSEVAAAR